jgi:hypothetical protein
MIHGMIVGMTLFHVRSCRYNNTVGVAPLIWLIKLILDYSPCLHAWLEGNWKIICFMFIDYLKSSLDLRGQQGGRRT